jgi:hypothetical protein
MHTGIRYGSVDVIVGTSEGLQRGIYQVVRLSRVMNVRLSEQGLRVEGITDRRRRRFQVKQAKNTLTRVLSEAPMTDAERYLVMEELTGRELDVEVLKQVCGVKRVFRPCEVKSVGWEMTSDDYYYIPSGKPPRTHMIDALPVPYFSRNIHAAWMIVEKLMPVYWLTVRTPFEAGSKYNAGFTRLGATGWNGRADYTGQGESAPEAICRAALELKKYAPELPPEHISHRLGDGSARAGDS